MRDDVTPCDGDHPAPECGDAACWRTPVNADRCNGCEPGRRCFTSPSARCLDELRREADANGCAIELKVETHEHAGIPSRRPFKPDRIRVDRGDFVRASGMTLCEVCGVSFFDHATVRGYEWLNRLRDGRLSGAIQAAVIRNRHEPDYVPVLVLALEGKHPQATSFDKALAEISESILSRLRDSGAYTSDTMREALRGALLDVLR